jgi:hypothetical protein
MEIIAEKVACPSQQGDEVEVSKDDRDLLASVCHLATAHQGDASEEEVPSAGDVGAFWWFSACSIKAKAKMEDTSPHRG